jgi:hypothetical protein
LLSKAVGEQVRGRINGPPCSTCYLCFVVSNVVVVVAWYCV